MINNCLYFIQKLFGEYCLGCHASEIDPDLLLCELCLAELEHNQTYCIQCAIPTTDDHLRCGYCQKTSPHFEHTFAPYLYEGKIKNMVLQLKSGRQLIYAKVLARLFLSQLETVPIGNYELLPVPTHNKRLRQRGFNQSLEMAKIIARKTGLKLSPTLAIRHKTGLSQQGLKRKQRLSNVRNAFRANSKLSGKNIIIFDDVMTSGATANELSKTLKKAGAESVLIWVIARTPAPK